MVTQIKQNYEKLMKAHADFKRAELTYNQKKKILDDLKEKMLSKMADAGTSTFKGAKGTLSMKEAKVPAVDDWNELYKLIHKKKAFDLLQRRVSTTAWRDRLEAGEKVPGVSSFTKFSLRITK
jgi:hypothetical protein